MEEEEEGVKGVGEGVVELALSIREAGVCGPVNKAPGIGALPSERGFSFSNIRVFFPWYLLKTAEEENKIRRVINQ